MVAGTFVLIRYGVPAAGGHHGIDVPTREELNRMLREAGFEVVLFRVSLGRMKALVQRPVRQVAPNSLICISRQRHRVGKPRFACDSFSPEKRDARESAEVFAK